MKGISSLDQDGIGRVCSFFSFSGDTYEVESIR